MICRLLLYIEGAAKNVAEKWKKDVTFKREKVSKFAIWNFRNQYRHMAGSVGDFIDFTNRCVL